MIKNTISNACLGATAIMLTACFIPQTGYDKNGDDCVTLTGADPFSAMYGFVNDRPRNCSNHNQMIKAKQETKNIKLDENQRLAISKYAAKILYPEDFLHHELARKAASILVDREMPYTASLSHNDCRRVSVKSQLAKDFQSNENLDSIYNKIAASWSDYYSDDQINRLERTAKRLDGSRFASRQFIQNLVYELSRDFAPQPMLDVLVHPHISAKARGWTESLQKNSKTLINQYREDANKLYQPGARCYEKADRGVLEYSKGRQK